MTEEELEKRTEYMTEQGKRIYKNIYYLIKENNELKEVHESDKRSLALIAKKGAKLELKIKKLTQHLEPQAMTALFEQVEEEVKQEQKIKELEKKISVLLSCKNCPENKCGYICQKEYEDKCLAQKIQYIKELQEEIKKWKDEWQEQVQKANDEGYARTLQTIQLNKAKKIISNLYAICKDNHYPNTSVLIERAEQFLKECE